MEETKCNHRAEAGSLIGAREHVIPGSMSNELVNVYRCPTCGTFYQKTGFFNSVGEPSLCELPEPTSNLNWKGYLF